MSYTIAGKPSLSLPHTHTHTLSLDWMLNLADSNKTRPQDP